MLTHVIFLIDSMVGGGAERAVVEMLRHLDHTRYRLSLALFRNDGDYMDLIPSYVTIIDLSRYTGRSNIIKRINGIRKMVADNNPDIIIAGLESPNLSLLRAAPFIRGYCRIVITEHNNLSMRLKKSRSELMKKAKSIEIQALYRLADRIIAVSDGIKTDLVHNFSLPDQLISVIHNPIDIEKIKLAGISSPEISGNYPNKPLTIISAGRLVPQKAFHELIKAFEKVREHVPALLLIFGEGPLRTELEQQVRSLNLEKYVKLPGFTNNLWSEMAKATIYASSSHWEGFHLTLTEAMACGIPVVATDCDYGPREIITHGKNGLVTPVGDVEALAKQIIELLCSDKRRRKLANEGLTRSYDFDSRVIAKKYSELIEAVL
ncbi:glycosyltransferase [Desulfococcus multivorans]|uniref:Glycosyl transferase group 1 n=1 Tax=Desulfococcus multivorans DSM 2059 TaxID=1121405 RepID=S7TAE2_DESML|nr:glycosyltransferase [Desulfococcus multivorans]AOY60124.1 glycosyl transferase, family I [Desulfococcus multivorans]AQV02259.2 glycosyl transferase [Desulfococcus multivorans]EPR34087.1 glycosyl transferase group 1 [Desulfococcus multivorans DSM 2059]SKA27351.1 Glycosyltransferase involved in cell wall bisynthesis [Desulfococcus multivorans DSM 2059]